VPFAEATRNPEVANRGQAYGLPGVCIDGNDVLAVHAAAGEAVRRARAGEGPTLLECRTYRTRSHAEGMRDAGYRTREEVEAWKARDPLAHLRAQLLAADPSAAALETIEAEVTAECAEAVEFARNSPWPDPVTASQHIYSEVEGQRDA
jgi:2-oxoisovalerate dehydrogenase E1 component